MENFLTQAPVLIPMLIALGLCAGFMAGLLGIGGGIVLVPGLYFLFKTLGYDPNLLMHLAVGTSLAIIIPTGLMSAFAHNRHGAVRGDVVRAIGPGIVGGVIGGTIIASALSGNAMTILFAGALMMFACLMQIPPRQKEGYASINQPIATIGGSFIGILSTLMGIGGATLNVPFMTLNGIPIHNAVASSAALGPFIALPGTIGFAIIGWHVAGLPPLSVGYINIAALLFIAPFSMMAAPYGARAAHKLSVKNLRRVFALFLIIVAIRMMMEAWSA